MPPEPRTLQEEVLEGLPLNEREFEIIEGAARGESAAQSGERIHLSHETVKSYRKRAVSKLAARNITHAVALAIGLGYVNVETILEEHERSRL